MYDFGSFLCRTLQHLKKTGGLKLDLKIHFWGLEKRYIHSWRQSDRTHTRKERSVWMCGAFTSYWKFGDIASAGFIFCGWWKPRARVRSQILIWDSPLSPPPSPWSQDEVAEEAVNHAAGSERPNNNSSSVCVFCYSPSERLDGGVRRDAARTQAPRPLLLNQRTYLLIRALTSTGRALKVFLNSWMMTRRKQLFAARSSVSL